jgi:hypothetical protein
MSDLIAIGEFDDAKQAILNLCGVDVGRVILPGHTTAEKFKESIDKINERLDIADTALGAFRDANIEDIYKLLGLVGDLPHKMEAEKLRAELEEVTKLKVTAMQNLVTKTDELIEARKKITGLEQEQKKEFPEKIEWEQSVSGKRKNLIIGGELFGKFTDKQAKRLNVLFRSGGKTIHFGSGHVWADIDREHSSELVDPAKAENIELSEAPFICEDCHKKIPQWQACQTEDNKTLCTECFGNASKEDGGKVLRAESVEPLEPADDPLINIREDEDLNVLMAGGHDVGNIHFYNGNCRRMFIDAFVKIRQFGGLTVQEWAKKVKLPERIDWKGVPGCYGASDLYIDNVLITRLAKDQVEALQPLLCYRKAVLDMVEDVTHSATSASSGQVGSGSACGGEANNG